MGVRNNFCSPTQSMEMNETHLLCCKGFPVCVCVLVGSRPEAGLSRLSVDRRPQLQAPPSSIDGGGQPTC